MHASIIIMVIMIGLFMILGIILHSGRGSFLIAGYNTMSKEEKDKYDTVALCKFIGKMMFALSFSMVFWVLSEVFEKGWLFTIGLILFIVIIVFMMIHVNTGNRFKK